MLVSGISKEDRARALAQQDGPRRSISQEECRAMCPPNTNEYLPDVLCDPKGDPVGDRVNLRCIYTGCRG